MAESDMQTTQQRPYLLRAMHEWMTDNALTPHIVIDVNEAQADLPMEHVKDGKLVINVSYSATQNLLIDNECASFAARFGGVSRQLSIPIMAIVGIYARESGQGMIFSSESAPRDAVVEDGKADSGNVKPATGRPTLKVIK